MNGIHTILTGGDWPTFFNQTIKELPWSPQVWYSVNGNGFGQNVAFILGYKTFFSILVKLCTEVLHLPWVITEKVIFFIPFWLLAILGSYFLSRYFFKNKPFNFLSSIIFATNTYALMLVGGGQMGVALSYALSPFVLLSLLQVFELQTLKRIAIASLLVGILLCIDPRVALIVLLISFVFLIFMYSKRKLLVFLSIGIVSVLLNSFWVVPFLFSGTRGLSEAYTGTDMLYFLSFAKLENSIGLLQPNWPENIFGKVGFMRPEFVLVSVLAFSSLIFVRKKTDRLIVIVALTALIGAFLAKGVNDPFGEIYYFLSNHVPLFTMFRDSTKWYLMIALSCSILIPFTLLRLSQLKIKLPYKTYVVFLLFALVWVVTIRQAIMGQLTGTFQAKTIPSEYIQLEKLLASQQEFSRILWVPQQSRFGYYSETHPAVSSYDLTLSHDAKPNFSFLQKKTTYGFVRDSAVRYVVVPFDPQGEIYLTDRKYDPKVYTQFYENMKDIPWLTQDLTFRKIGVFKVKDPKMLAYIASDYKPISLTKVTQTSYVGNVKRLAASARIVFSQEFDKHWILKTKNATFTSTPYKKKFNSFFVPMGTTEFTIKYATQKWVTVGMYISLMTMVIVVVAVLFRKK